MAQSNWTTLAASRAGGIGVELRRYDLPSPAELTVIETQPVVSMMLPPYPVERLGRYEGSGTDYRGLGNIVFTPAGTSCQFRGDGGHHLTITCLFDRDLFDEVTGIADGWNRERLLATLDVGGTAGGALDMMLRRIADELRAPGFATETLVEGLGLAALAELSRFLRAGGGEARQSGRLSAMQLRRLDEYVDAFPRSAPTIGTLAKLLGMSPRRLTTLFRDTTGLTVRAWVEAKRMDHARRLLTETDQPLKMIAYDLGFANQGVFSTAFRRVAGLAPSTYRERYQ